MSPRIKSLLLPFYFGSIKDDERTLVERELLVDTEVLLDYLDMKRTIEKAPVIPSSASPELWQKLRLKSARRQKVIWTVSVGMAAVLALVIILVVSKKESHELNPQVPVQNELLFDSMNEPSAGPNVL